ncbi:hypothetical protein [uncultured Clostridium sp.]|uniref:hypothetical protein n=1 Tax=uncultured Clostridium sp. TaxID=59620 RepID=UPI0025F2C2ED|nr:hypothetical protein [uncultured Clostridium sp.]
MLTDLLIVTLLVIVISANESGNFKCNQNKILKLGLRIGYRALNTIALDYIRTN